MRKDENRILLGFCFLFRGRRKEVLKLLVVRKCTANNRKPVEFSCLELNLQAMLLLLLQPSWLAAMMLLKENFVTLKRFFW